jgi:hypothetical protein
MMWQQITPRCREPCGDLAGAYPQRCRGTTTQAQYETFKLMTDVVELAYAVFGLGVSTQIPHTERIHSALQYLEMIVQGIKQIMIGSGMYVIKLIRGVWSKDGLVIKPEIYAISQVTVIDPLYVVIEFTAEILGGAWIVRESQETEIFF